MKTTALTYLAAALFVVFISWLATVLTEQAEAYDARVQAQSAYRENSVLVGGVLYNKLGARQ